MRLLLLMTLSCPLFGQAGPVVERYVPPPELMDLPMIQRPLPMTPVLEPRSGNVDAWLRPFTPGLRAMAVKSPAKPDSVPATCAFIKIVPIPAGVEFHIKKAPVGEYSPMPRETIPTPPTCDLTKR